MHTNNYFKSDKNFRFFTLTSSILIFILIVFGGIVRATGSGGACTDWPACMGVWTFPETMDAGIAFSHRLLSLFVGIFLGIGNIFAWKRYGIARNAMPYYLSLALYLVQAGSGWILSNTAAEWISSVHLAISLIILSLMTFATVKAWMNIDSKLSNIQITFMSSFERFSLVAIAALGLLLVSGVAVSGSNIQANCSGWPICEGMLRPESVLDIFNIFHRVSVIITGVILIKLVGEAWRSQKSDPTILVATTSAAVLFFSQALLASQMVNEYPLYLLILHQSTAVAVWVSLAILVSFIGLNPKENIASEEEITQSRSLKFGKLKDLLMLTKPIVVALLLVTTYAGMVIGAQRLPSLSLTFWTLLGGFMAAGGSGAINQYIDRFDDIKMQRTQNRPIPSGRLTPAEGLAFGTALSLGSFFIMVAFVNLIAALLTLAGIFYYVLIYSIFLKKTTVQNIVIGGGAGAIPPLVGWAAATGGLNIPSLFLFAVIFMWTPPHFWALALVRRKDYARAGVPMLPVIKGEKATRWQILLYTIELVALTILLPIFGLGGSVYMVGAVILGLWIVASAYRLWKKGGNKLAWRMYRYSSMYLAFLFMVMMLDALL